MNVGSWINILFHDIRRDMEEDMIKYLGLKVRSLRGTEKLTQEELANFCDVSWRTISNLERGQGAPDLFTVYKIAKRFDVGMDDLLNIKVQHRKSLSRISLENQLIERIRTLDDRLLDFIADQLDVVLKHFKE